MIEQASLVIGEGNWAVKSDSLLGYKINNGKYYPREMSVVRATTGTRINEDGLVEVVPYNLLNWSEDFSNGVWTNYSLVITTNATTAPNGTLTADNLVPNTSNVAHFIENSNYINLSIGQTYTTSFYAKANGYNFIQFTADGGDISGNPRANFNLSNGTLGSVDSGITATIENVGNGWYRCSATFVVAYQVFNNIFCVINSSTATRAEAFAGNATSGVYLYGAQLVEGSSALDYLPTTDRLDVARIDYSSESAALLVEPQRTNLLTYSSSFDNAAWVKFNANITANSVISPSGIQDADTLTASGGTALHTCYWPTGQFGANYTISVYAKKNTNNFLQIYTDFVNTDFANFDLNNGVVGSVGSTVVSSSIENIGNGWYRCSFVTGSASSRYVNFSIISSASSPRAETNSLTTSIYIWGAQLEAGSYPTSLIPTQGSTVTRNADVISKTGIADLIGQTEGTLYVDVDLTHTNKGSNEYLAQIWINSSSRILLYRSSVNGGIGAVILQASSTIYSFVSTVNTNERHKIAFAYKSGDIAFYIDGSSVSTSSSSFSAFSTIANYDLGIHTATGSPLEIGDYSYNSAAIFKTRLTNAELATLTTI